MTDRRVCLKSSDCKIDSVCVVNQPFCVFFCVSRTHQVADGFRALAVLPPLGLQRRLQADALLLQAQLAALQQAALVLQLAHVSLQLLQLLAALRLSFAEPRRRFRLGSQQRVGLLQLTAQQSSL